MQKLNKEIRIYRANGKVLQINYTVLGNRYKHNISIKIKYKTLQYIINTLFGIMK